MSIYFTVTGTVHQLGQSFIKPGDKVTLVKEPDNQFDKEAIAVKMDVLGKIGYVANSYNTIIGDCFSAGRIYDKFEDTATAVVKYNISIEDHGMPYGLVCEME